MVKPRVVITGLGSLSPNGSNKNEYWQALQKGESGIGEISLFPTDKLACKIAGEVKNLSYECIPHKERKRVSRIVPMAVLAAEEALQDAEIPYTSLTELQRQEIGVIIGTGAGGLDFGEQEYEKFFSSQARISPFAIVSSFVGMVSSEVSIHFGFRGPSHVISTGCTSSTDAIGYATSMVQSGTIRYAVTGGAEACITPAILTAFVQMGTTTTKWNHDPQRASRPFNVDRDGFVLSEGSWILILETLENAVARNAKIYAEVAGYGSTCDAYHKVQIMPGGAESARAIKIAVESAGLTPQEVEYINLHGTATKINDELETLAVKNVFDGRSRRIPASSTKSMIGHPQGACGAAGIIATCMAIDSGVIHPTINLDNPDPACDLDYVPNTSRKSTVQTALCNTIAFGSKNSAIVLKKV
ncbi:beta-ketoacyl-[acyl-carrier-protein] synthase family protein [bacterium]|nr:beta-ketoacyl-[acyl-carrier-protein] synthase family protein [bacterium]MCI0602228.1 beta-ketoacyl-[acyl-carrier-protein] synthase family protein [bacterium]